jgi:hypothetical protein
VVLVCDTRVEFGEAKRGRNAGSIVRDRFEHGESQTDWSGITLLPVLDIHIPFEDASTAFMAFSRDSDADSAPILLGSKFFPLRLFQTARSECTPPLSAQM